MYTIRISPMNYDECVKRLNTYCSKYAGAYYFAREIASSVHLQGWMMVDNSNVSKINKNLRNALGDSVPKGNKGGSIKEVKDPDAIKRYCAKGESNGVGPVTVIYSGLSINEKLIEEWHTEYWLINDEIKQRAKKERIPLNSELDKYAKTIPVDKEFRYKLARKYVDLCVQIEKPINVYYARNVVNMVWAKNDPEASEIITLEIMNKI